MTGEYNTLRHDITTFEDELCLRDRGCLGDRGISDKLNTIIKSITHFIVTGTKLSICNDVSLIQS